MRIIIVVGALILAASCGGGDPTGPNSPSGVSILVAAGVSLGGTYTATLNNQTYTTPNGFSVSLAPGTYEMSGTYTGGTLIVGFTSVMVTGGGVQVGSVQSLAGVVLTTLPCGVTYSEGQGPRSYRVRFTVGTNPNTSCQ